MNQLLNLVHQLLMTHRVKLLLVVYTCDIYPCIERLYTLLHVSTIIHDLSQCVLLSQSYVDNELHE